MRNVLLIAYHFPPSAISSGHLRTLALTHYLPQFGWRSTVLSAHPRAYTRRDDRLLAEVPDTTAVTRAFALDTRRHLGIRGVYPSFLAQPDRWVSWWLGGVAAGWRLIRRDRPQLIWSTYPIVTAHLIAYTLHRWSGIPWVADFRDPVTNADVASSALTARSRRWVERRTIASAARSVFTTSGAMTDYAQRYPNREASLTVIPNGYDERDFVSLSNARPLSRVTSAKAITLVHSGVLYPDGRNPHAFLAAIAALQAKRVVTGDSLQVVLRASGHRKKYDAMIRHLGVQEIVRLESSTRYREALAEMASADGLLLFQGSKYNRQIPAKVYEYLRVGRPILALIDPAGDTAALLASEGINSIAPMDDSAKIAAALQDFLTRVRARTIEMPTAARVARYSREAGAQRFAALFDHVAGG